MNQDTVANLYDFAAREYDFQGRGPSPDPAGLGAVSLTDPRSLNRYIYVSIRPLEAVDPLSLCDCLNVDCFECHSLGGGVEKD